MNGCFDWTHALPIGAAQAHDGDASDSRTRRSSSERFTLLVVVAVRLAGCSTYRPLGMTLAADGRPTLVVARCDDRELVSAAELSLKVEFEPRTTLWRIEAEEPQPLDRVTVGNVPSGFEETVPLGVPLVVGVTYRVQLGDDPTGSAAGDQMEFRLSELDPTDVLLDIGERVSVEEFDRRVASYCDARDPLVDVRRILAVGLTFAAATSIAVLVIFARRRHRRS